MEWRGKPAATSGHGQCHREDTASVADSVTRVRQNLTQVFTIRWTWQG